MDHEDYEDDVSENIEYENTINHLMQNLPDLRKVMIYSSLLAQVSFGLVSKHELLDIISELYDCATSLANNAS